MLNTRSPEEPYLVERNPGYFEYQLPISVKAVVGWRGRLPLLRNERDEWELPGGKLDLGEDPASCLAREIREELAWDAAVGDPELTLATPDEAEVLNLPDGYRTAIRLAVERGLFR